MAKNELVIKNIRGGNSDGGGMLMVHFEAQTLPLCHRYTFDVPLDSILAAVFELKK